MNVIRENTENICSVRSVARAMLVVVLFFASASIGHAETAIDTSLHTTASTHNGTTLTTVFTTDQVGYAFYRDASGVCAYSKTTDGGTSWGAAVTVDAQTDCVRVAVWYDQWTTGDTTGTFIHIITMDVADLWYVRLDTTTDGISTPLNISGANQAGTLAAGQNLPSLTKATDGTLYAGVQDVDDSFVVRCSVNCTAGIANWNEAGINPFDLANDWLLLMPIATGNVLAVRWDISTDDVQSKIWNTAGGSWSGTWTNLDLTCINSNRYDGHFGATVHRLTGDIYLDYACDIQNIGNADDDIRTAIYNSTTNGWTQRTDVITNEPIKGITGAKIAVDENTGNIYAVYTARTNPGANNAANIYYKVSTDGMTTWGAELGPLNATPDDIYGLRLNGVSDERIYITWIYTATDDLFGETLADLTPSTYEQTAYRWFRNADATSVGNSIASLNSSGISASQGNPFRLRMLIHVGGDGADIGKDNFKLQFAVSAAGGCDTSFVGETYTDLSDTAGDIRFYNNAVPLDGAALTTHAQDPTHNADTVVGQTYEEQNTFTNSIAKIFGGQDGLWDFALVNTAAPVNAVYCFRIVRESGALLSAYTAIPEAVMGADPTFSNMLVNNGNEISLIEGTTVAISVQATVSDENGYADIDQGASSAVLYRSGAGEACTYDQNNCYISSCSFSGCGGSSCVVTCTANVQYFADPTDIGTFVAETWLGKIVAGDVAGDSASSTAPAVELNTLYSLDATSSINYGSLDPATDTGSTNQTIVVTNTGNAAINPRVSGTDMTGTGTIAVTRQKFSLGAFVYALAGTILSAIDEATGLSLSKPFSTTPVQGTLYWGIGIPNNTASGSYSGTNTIIAAP